MKIKKVKVIEAIKSGALNYSKIAQLLNVHRKSISDYFRKNPELKNVLSEAIDEDFESKKSEIEDKAFSLAMAGEVQIIKFLLERKYGYKNNLDVTTNGENINSISINIIHTKENGIEN